MRTRDLAVGAACGLALGAGVVAVADAGTQTADAQSKFTVSAKQLRINQRISSAAVKRSNRGLNYLAPIRTAQTDAADDGSKGVLPLSQVPGSGDGWVTSQIANAAITTAKLANESVDSQKIAPGGVTSGDLADNAVTEPKIGAGAVTAAKIADGAVGTGKIADGTVGSSTLSATLRAQIEETAQSTGVSTAGAFLAIPIPTGNNEIVLSTSDDSGGKTGKGPVTFTAPRRIVADGFVDVRETNVAQGNAICFLGAKQGGTTSSFSTPQDSVTVPQNTSVRVALSGVIDLSPGTYDVVILCRGAASVNIVGMTVNAVVADQ